MVNNIQATGISFGLDRLASLAKLDLEKKKCLIISIDRDKEAINLSQHRFSPQRFGLGLYYLTKFWRVRSNDSCFCGWTNDCRSYKLSKFAE
jgi:hypothetical protein